MLMTPLRTDKQSESAETLASRVQETLRRSHVAFRKLQVAKEGDTLILRGRLPSFYLKQTVQTIAAEIHGVEQLSNRIEVVRTELSC
ncbi:BON domain-containing protein [Planctomicrobium sp. SH661]|uniref:BON domain-containing protein n=1 Tax=Planctomicrobium sp. SH661 TaxID=3448124 RepID=UPI003F5B2010